jgi:hypothetical protein
MSKSGIPWIMCESHKESYDMSPKAGIALDSVVRNWNQYLQIEIQRFAYEDGDKEVALLYDGMGSMLDQARILVEAADAILADARRQNLASARATVALRRAAAAPPPVTLSRPPMSTLPSYLEEESDELFDA